MPSTPVTPAAITDVYKRCATNKTSKRQKAAPTTFHSNPVKSYFPYVDGVDPLTIHIDPVLSKRARSADKIEATSIRFEALVGMGLN